MMLKLKCICFLLLSLVIVAENQLPLPSQLLATSPEVSNKILINSFHFNLISFLIQPPFVEIPGIKSSYNALIAKDTLDLLAMRLKFS